MKLKLHTFSNPVTVDTEDIKAFVWSIELGKIELVTGNKDYLIPVDEELWEIEELYQEKKNTKR